MRKYAIARIYSCAKYLCATFMMSTSVWGANDQPITLGEALLVASDSHPRLEALRSRSSASEARLERASRFRNPQLFFEAENFAGSGRTRGFSGSELTLALSQVIELGAKRKKRTNLATSEVRVVSAELRRMELRVLRDVSLSFIDLAEAEALLETDQQIAAAALTLYSSVSANVEAGKVPPVEEVKAKVELARARLMALKTQNAIANRREQLAASMGVETLRSASVDADLFGAEAPASIDQIYAHLSNNLDLAVVDSKIERAENAVAVARAEQIPNVSVSAGVRRLEGSDDNAAVMSISVPLFVFDDRKPLAVAAEHDLAATIDEKRAAELRIRKEIANAHQLLQANHNEFRVMRDEVVPSAELALERVAESYRLGKLTLLDLIDSQRTFFDAKRQVIQSASEFQRASIVLESLIGRVNVAAPSSHGER